MGAKRVSNSKTAGKPVKPKSSTEPSLSRVPVTAAFTTATICKNVGQASLFIIFAAQLSAITQLSLAPVYGSIPTAFYHGRGTAITLFLAFSMRSLLSRRLRSKARDLLPVLAFYIPAVQAYLFTMSSQFGPTVGPVVTQALTYYPVLFLAGISARYLLDRLPLRQFGPVVEEAVPAIACTALFMFLEQKWQTALPRNMGSSYLTSRSGLQLMTAAQFGLLSLSPQLLLAIPALITTLPLTALSPSAAALTRLNRTLASHQYTILGQRDSVTGYVSVLESQKDGFRVMRCDHSLLGGEWLLTPSRQRAGQTQKETIYSVFTMLESIRLIKSTSDRSDADKNALFIGLGIGISPSAFIQHGINTTIVELDPAVHDFAIQHFGLPTNHTAVIQDAIPFVADTSKSHPNSYDYIVHDVFTGGVEPTALFTLEFLSGLEKLLKPDGVIAINYAGDTLLPPARWVLNTIHAVFPTCRIYRDTLPEDTSTTFINMVVFCTKQADTPITFRQAVDRDFLGSVARQNWIPPQDELELHFSDFKGEDGSAEDNFILKRGEDRIGKYHPEAAVRHWHIMRTVLPNAVWESV